MDTLLRSLVVFASLMTLCNAQCYLFSYDRRVEDSPDECRDSDGATHQLNVEWKTENCDRCICDESKVQCCSTVAVPTGFDTTKCKKIFHKENCSYSVVEVENPENECPVTSWIM
ncbi:beta-microseminoprotein isoform X1 [Ochotona princeps]|uniref:beta-microseminoprotein isoform X1 n=1 Tax=Ochotona princeps TaxID=9978 RepID=UPI002714802B|nr:beta-microseminoprotein isoform X1 [Ochotona princeps]